MDNYLAYLIEEENKEVIDIDHGFVAFQVLGEELFVTDIFVKKESRDKGYGLELAHKVLDAAKERMCKYMSCNVYAYSHNYKRATRKIFLFNKFGFEIIAAEGNIITMKKEL